MKTYKFDEIGHILWSEQIDENTHSSGVIWEGRTLTRTNENGEEETYSPYDELIASGVEIEPYIEDPETIRSRLKAERDKALDEITYDLGNGQSIQCREKDEIRLRRAVNRMKAEGEVSRPWIATDNTLAMVTLEQFESALIHGEDEVARIFEQYMGAL